MAAVKLAAKEKHHHADKHNAHTQNFTPVYVFDRHAQKAIVVNQQARQQLPQNDEQQHIGNANLWRNDDAGTH